MKHSILNSIMFAVAVLMAVSCSHEKFTVNGEIQNAKDSVLYFENWSLEGPVVIDSVKLDEAGHFEFTADVKKTGDSIKVYAPEFYRLRIADQIINISSDSTEVVTVKAHYPEMSWKYDVSGSDNCKKIQELSQLQIQLQNQCILISQSQELNYEQIGDSINNVISRYKERIKNDYIVKEPMKAYAYFALFQAVGNRLIFNPRTSKEDIRMFAAVATSWDAYYPGSLRGENLHNIAVEGMKTQRILDARNQDLQIAADKVNVTNMIDISLEDNRGHMRKLSDLKGKVVLLDFHSFAQDGSTAYIMQLRDLYNKYHDRGLEVYQVGLLDQEHFWKTSVSALPWVSVYDPAASSATTYNVQGLPSGYILDRECTPVMRYDTLEGLAAAIEKYL